MKISIFPKTILGKLAITLMIGFFVLFAVFSLFVLSGERGGKTFFSNLKLAIPFTLAFISGIASFFTGFISFFKKERSVLVFLCSLFGFLILLWSIAEIIFPH